MRASSSALHRLRRIRIDNTKRCAHTCLFDPAHCSTFVHTDVSSIGVTNRVAHTQSVCGTNSVADHRAYVAAFSCAKRGSLCCAVARAVSGTKSCAVTVTNDDYTRADGCTEFDSDADSDHGTLRTHIKMYHYFSCQSFSQFDSLPYHLRFRRSFPAQHRPRRRRPHRLKDRHKIHQQRQQAYHRGCQRHRRPSQLGLPLSQCLLRLAPPCGSTE